jgi:hypothetical protein
MTNFIPNAGEGARGVSWGLPSPARPRVARGGLGLGAARPGRSACLRDPYLAAKEDFTQLPRRGDKSEVDALESMRRTLLRADLGRQRPQQCADAVRAFFFMWSKTAKTATTKAVIADNHSVMIVPQTDIRPPTIIASRREDRERRAITRDDLPLRH